MQPSSSTSGLRLFRGRYLWIVFIALILSGGFYAALWYSAKSDAPNADSDPQGTAAEAERAGIQPARFQEISEFTDGAQQKLRFSGSGEPGSVVILKNLGERLIQIRVNDLGQWNVTVPVEENPMAVEAQLYVDEETLAIQSEETVFRIPIPTGEEAAGANYVTEALIIVTSPGNPSRLIQSPFGDVPKSGPLSLSVIDYDYAGGILITGTSSIPGRIRVYAQDAVIGDIGIGVSGRWSYIAGRMLPRGEIDIRFELNAAQGIPNAPEGPINVDGTL